MNQRSPTAPAQIHIARLFDGEHWQHHVRLHWADGRITAMQANQPLPTDGTPVVAAPGLASPGLVDIQVNGGGGVMFNDAPNGDGALRITQAHAGAGTTSLLLTLITDTRSKLATAQQAAHAALAARMPGAAGVHLEGPFLQVQRKGIHRAEHITAITDADVDAIATQAAGLPCLVTLAPECVAVAQIRRLSDAGVRVFAGHTEASHDVLQRAIDEGGLCGVTHLFNAMSQLGPREAGVVGAALLRPALWAGIVLDGHHVSVPSVQIAWRMRGREQMVLVSDAMATAGTAQTSFELQGQTIHVRNGRCEDDAGTLAGAAICLSDAVRIGVQGYGLALDDALYSATAAPARLMGLAPNVGLLQPGAQADLVLWDEGLSVQAVLQRGQWVRPLPNPVV